MPDDFRLVASWSPSVSLSAGEPTVDRYALDQHCQRYGLIGCAGQCFDAEPTCKYYSACYLRDAGVDHFIRYCNVNNLLYQLCWLSNGCPIGLLKAVTVVIPTTTGRRARLRRVLLLIRTTGRRALADAFGSISQRHHIDWRVSSQRLV